MAMQIDDFINLIKNNEQNLIPLLDEEKYDHIKVSDIFAKHLGFDAAPKTISDSELDNLIIHGESIEITRGFGSEDVLQSFMSGKSGFGSYDEGGAGHYFAMETLNDSAKKKLGLNLDLVARGSFGPSMSYQATHYAGESGSTLIRAGMPVDMKIATKEMLKDEINKIGTEQDGFLNAFRKNLLGREDKTALNVFDRIFSRHSEYTSSIAAMIMRIRCKHCES